MYRKFFRDIICPKHERITSYEYSITLFWQRYLKLPSRRAIISFVHRSIAKLVILNISSILGNHLFTLLHLDRIRHNLNSFCVIFQTDLKSSNNIKLEFSNCGVALSINNDCQNKYNNQGSQYFYQNYWIRSQYLF